MSPPARRRRRWPARPRDLIALVAAAIVVVLLLIGGLAHVGSQSLGYWQDVDRSFAAGVAPLAKESNAVGRDLAADVPAMPAATRSGLQAELDTLVRGADRLSSEVSLLSSPGPADGVGAAVAAAFAERAQAVADVRATVDRLLAMTPLAVAGQTGAVSSVPATPPPISQAKAQQAFRQVGTLLAQADRTYADARQRLRRAPGRPMLALSAWVTNTAQWHPVPVAELVGALLGSPTLAPVRDVELLTRSMSLTPAPVPLTAAPGSDVALVPPTHAVSVSVVVAEQGNVVVRGVGVFAEATPSGGGAASRARTRVTLMAGTSVAVRLGPLRVRPGTTYAVRVTLEAPTGEAAGATTETTFTLQVAAA